MGIVMRFYKLLNKRFVQLQEMIFRNERVLGEPFQLVLETVNMCNLRCPLCATPFREKRIPRGMLKFEEAKRIIDQFPALVSIIMPIWGETFLNKDTFKVSDYAQKKGIKVEIRSNLNLFNQDMAQKLIESVDKLVISLDGASQETYEIYRIGGNFNTVIRNIKLITEMQRDKNNYKTKLIWKMIVHRFNEHEVEKAKAWAGDLGIDFRMVQIYTPPSLANEWKPLKKLGSSECVHTDHVSLCNALWQTPTVNFNGDVFPCCSEFSREDAIGNVFDEPFRNIWNNKRYKVLRRLNKKKLNCESCHIDKETNWYKRWVR
jgi:radical SAM protein with 4Fe4S-binding SPASM domain